MRQAWSATAHNYSLANLLEQKGETSNKTIIDRDIDIDIDNAARITLHHYEGDP
jgi:hypothetical protein